MVKITSNSKLQFDLVREALSNHGFKFEATHYKKYRWLGEIIYEVRVDYAPNLDLLKHLLVMAEENEDYINAEGIKKMIERSSNK